MYSRVAAEVVLNIITIYVFKQLKFSSILLIYSLFISRVYMAKVIECRI